jgi:hypothetical protein
VAERTPRQALVADLKRTVRARLQLLVDEGRAAGDPGKASVCCALRGVA